MFGKIRKYFISGLVIFLPIALTVYLFYLAISFTDKFFREFFEKLGFNFGDFYGLSVIIGISIIILVRRIPA